MWNLVEKTENAPDDIIYVYTHDNITNFDEVWAKIQNLVKLTSNRKINIDSMYFIPVEEEGGSEQTSILNPTSWTAFIQEETFMNFLKEIVERAFSVGILGNLLTDAGEASHYELIFFSAEEKHLKESSPKIALISNELPMDIFQQFVDRL